MKKKDTSRENKSLKTFFLYSILVAILLISALGVKLILVIRQSKFDGSHQFVVAIARKNIVESLVAFDPGNSSSSYLDIKKNSISLSVIAKQVGLTPDAVIESDIHVPADSDVANTFFYYFLRYGFIHSDLTAYDLIHLYVVSKNVATNRRETASLDTLQDSKKTDEVISRLFTDVSLSQENLSIQVVNASGFSGYGARMGRVIENRGGNVISVITAHATEQHSKIQYFGKESYTLQKLRTLFHFPVEFLVTQPIANIVIILGKDTQNTELF